MTASTNGADPRPDETTPTHPLPPSLELEWRGAVAVLRLNRAAKRNALDTATVSGLEQFVSAPPAAARAGSQVVKASGDVRAAVAQVQALLGDPANGITPGQQAAGRREISWDGVPPELTNTDALPADQFSRNGLIYTIVGSGLRVTDI